MENDKIIVSGAGCCLIDRIYNNITFDSEEFKKYRSKTTGDGGLAPGKLEFEENFEQFTGEKFAVSLSDITKGKEPDGVNIGGPCIVALINLAQLTYGNSDVRFYGVYGDDEVGDLLLTRLSQVPVNIDNYKKIEGCETASTSVLSDPDFDNGHGERIFVNTIGASWRFSSEDLDDSFYNSDIVILGATALVPTLHESLDIVLKKSKDRGAFTVVTTVYDSLNERKNPNEKWPLGGSDDCYKYIDLLIVDSEEASRLSGTSKIEDAMKFFKDSGVGAAIVTNGAKDVYLYSSGLKFKKQKLTSMPVSTAVGEEIKSGRRGDTTGCGDNFAGGVVASIVAQKQQGIKQLDIVEACIWGIISGGFACFYFGGTYFEKQLGEKKSQIDLLYSLYKKQIAGADLL